MIKDQIEEKITELELMIERLYILIDKDLQNIQKNRGFIEAIQIKLDIVKKLR